ncbi:hypothetical protein [Amniculibacterium sp. G2-70]
MLRKNIPNQLVNFYVHWADFCY